MATLEPSELFQYNQPAASGGLSSQVMRDNFTALARSHYTTDLTKPVAPQDGGV